MESRPYADRTPPDNEAVRQLIALALREDVGPGDITTDNLLPPDRTGRGDIVAKEPLVCAGLDLVRRVCQAVDADVVCRPLAHDGEAVPAGATVMTLAGRLRSLLLAERTALNFLQRLSGIATRTRHWAAELDGSTTRLVDTRKTAPGWRSLEKYAVRVGGGANHRGGLFDGVLIKDNHIAACGAIGTAVAAIRRRVSHLTRIEVEVGDEADVRAALAAGADAIMLDNMDLPAVRRCVEIIAGRALVEVSGNVGRGDLAGLAAAGVDIVSAGALTHSAPSVDISMRIEATAENAGP